MPKKHRNPKTDNELLDPDFEIMDFLCEPYELPNKKDYEDDTGTTKD